MISGRIDPVSGRVIFQPAYALDLPIRLPTPGDSMLELLDIDGNVIAAYPFAPAEAQADSFQTANAFESTGFHLIVPFDEQTTSIRVRRGEAILGTLTAGKQAPSLEVGVAALSVDSRSMRVQWSGQDAEGDVLHYLVRASTDGGKTWQVIGANLTSPTIKLNSDEWSGESVLVEVLASDGLHTTSRQLGSFSVP
jgi:hypothetical protein